MEIVSENTRKILDYVNVIFRQTSVILKRTYRANIAMGHACEI